MRLKDFLKDLNRVKWSLTDSKIRTSDCRCPLEFIGCYGPSCNWMALDTIAHKLRLPYPDAIVRATDGHLISVDYAYENIYRLRQAMLRACSL